MLWTNFIYICFIIHIIAYIFYYDNNILIMDKKNNNKTNSNYDNSNFNIRFPFNLEVINYLGKGTVDLGFITIPQLFSYRIGEIGIENVIYNLNIANHNNYFFLLFSAVNNPGFALTEFGTIYYILVPFAIFGFILAIKDTIKNIKERKFSIKTIFLIQFLGMSIGILFFKSLQVHKLNSLFIPYTIL